jgi:hypothetical protein
MSSAATICPNFSPNWRDLWIFAKFFLVLISRPSSLTIPKSLNTLWTSHTQTMPRDPDRARDNPRERDAEIERENWSREGETQSWREIPRWRDDADLRERWRGRKRRRRKTECNFPSQFYNPKIWRKTWYMGPEILLFLSQFFLFPLGLTFYFKTSQISVS